MGRLGGIAIINGMLILRGITTLRKYYACLNLLNVTCVEMMGNRNSIKAIAPIIDHQCATSHVWFGFANILLIYGAPTYRLISWMAA